MLLLFSIAFIQLYLYFDTEAEQENPPTAHKHCEKYYLLNGIDVGLWKEDKLLLVLLLHLSSYHLADLTVSENFHSISVWSKNTDRSYLYPIIFSTV